MTEVAQEIQKEAALTQEQIDDKVFGEVQLFKEITSKVFVGQVFPNYKSLCLLMGEEPQAGSSKEAQLRTWSMYFRWSKVGHKLTIEEVFGKPSYDNLFRSNEQHIKDSYALLGKFLLDNLEDWEQSPKHDTIYTSIIFNKDIAIECGFITQLFYTDAADKLAKGNFPDEAIPEHIQKWLAGVVKGAFRDVANGLLASLSRKSSLHVERILVGYKNKERFILDTDDYVKYKEVERRWVEDKHFGSYIAFLQTGSRARFWEYVKWKGLDYDSFYTGYRITFSVVSLKQDIAKLEQKMLENNSHFKGKVKGKIEKDKIKEGRYKLDEDVAERLDILLEDYLTYGT
jgi:hypothetical protein